MIQKNNSKLYLSLVIFLVSNVKNHFGLKTIESQKPIPKMKAEERLSAGDDVGEISKMLFPGGGNTFRGKYQEMHDITMEKISSS